MSHYAAVSTQSFIIQGDKKIGMVQLHFKNSYLINAATAQCGTIYMEKLTADYQCTEVTSRVVGKSAVLEPVQQPTENNAAYSAYAPQGRLQIFTDQPDAADFFVAGQQYTLTLESKTTEETNA